MLHCTGTVLSVCLFPFKYCTPWEKKQQQQQQKKHVDLPQWSSWTKKTAESSQLNKSVMFVRKLNCLQKRRHFYAFFEPLKREASVEGEHARRGGVLACFELGFARWKKSEKIQRLFCRLNISDQPAWQVPLGEGKGEERELVWIPFNLFFPSFAPAMQAK